MQKEAMLYEKLNDNKVHCFLCAHHCTIFDSHYGFCGVRKNESGNLYTCVYAEVMASHADPIEKKPLYHFLPGTKSFSIATMGCNFHCGFCQNWEISQRSKRDRSSGGYELRPEEVVGEAKKTGCKSISYTYTEPTIFFEYAYDTAQIAKEEGLYNNFVTNGYMTQEALETISPYLDAANVDLKSFREEFYRNTCKGHLQPVLDSITLMKHLNIWVEITTLLIPGENDSNQELKQITEFIANLDNSIPWHISKFHPDYQFTDHSLTSPETLRKARGIGYSNGLHYIYLGNVQEGTDTRCPHCEEVVIERTHATITENIIESGKCPFCGMVIEGVFN
jgi:pyruvate formate lyase activating enzyme